MVWVISNTSRFLQSLPIKIETLNVSDCFNHAFMSPIASWDIPTFGPTFEDPNLQPMRPKPKSKPNWLKPFSWRSFPQKKSPKIPPKLPRVSPPNLWQPLDEVDPATSSCIVSACASASQLAKAQDVFLVPWSWQRFRSRCFRCFSLVWRFNVFFSVNLFAVFVWGRMLGGCVSCLFH